MLNAQRSQKRRIADRIARPCRLSTPKLLYRKCGLRKISGTREIRLSVVLAYTPDGHWRNRAEFFRGREQMQAFLTRKWTRELDYRLIKEIWTFRENRIAVRFAYEFHDDSGNWFRSYGNENWDYDEHGLTRLRISEHQRSSDQGEPNVSIIGILVADQTGIRV